MKNKKIQITKASKEDVQEIKDLLKTSWINTYGRFFSEEMIEEITSSWHDPEKLAEQIRDPNFYFAVAKGDTGKLHGVVTAVKHAKSNDVYLTRLYIHTDFQGQGIGSQLLANTIETFPHADSVLVEIEKMNQKTQDFYQKHGFEEFNESEQTVGDSVFLVVEMIKKLR